MNWCLGVVTSFFHPFGVGTFSLTSILMSSALASMLDADATDSDKINVALTLSLVVGIVQV